MEVFVAAATLGPPHSASIPVLPEEIRRHICSYLAPTPILYCSACAQPVALVHHDGRVTLVCVHISVWQDEYKCVECTAYPRGVLL